MVAGGIGQTPFLALAQEHLGHKHYGPASGARQPPGTQRRPSPLPRTMPPRTTLLYGARSRSLLAGVEDFRRCGVDVRISTDDGSAGHHGLVTDLLSQLLRESSACSVVCCGPEKMMEAVAHVCQAASTPCLVSLETPMACGIGICFSCVARVRDDRGGWDYRRTCVEGPVFAAEQIVF